MFRTLMPLSHVALFGATVLLAPADGAADAGGGPAGGGANDAPGADDGADAGDLGDGQDDGSDDTGDDADGGDAGREDDLEDLLADNDEDDEQQGTRTDQDRIKKLAAKNRKLRRQIARRLPTLQRLKDVDVDGLMHKARNYDAIEEAARRNPRLRALLNGGDDAEDEDDRPARRSRKTEDADFDEAKLPFDANKDPVHRYFANLAKQNHELQRQFSQLTKRIDGYEKQGQQRDETSSRAQWGDAVRAAGEQIGDKKIAKLVQDAMRGAFNTPGIRQRYSPQQVLNHYLKEYGVNPGQARRAADAAKQRIAERNKRLPNHAERGGQPAGARPKKESLADVRKRLSRSVS